MGSVRKTLSSSLLSISFLVALTAIGQTKKLPNNIQCRVQYPKSKFIKKFEWLNQPSKYPGTASDMHWWTWGIDDNIYILDDDGENFGGRY